MPMSLAHIGSPMGSGGKPLVLLHGQKVLTWNRSTIFLTPRGLTRLEQKDCNLA